MQATRPFAYHGRRLYCGNVDLEALAHRFGTPLYVYDLDTIAAAYRGYTMAFRGVPLQVCAAIKANNHLAVLRLLARLGSGFDVVSGGELEFVLHAGADPGKVVYSGVGKTAAEMDLALRAGILLFQVESEPELELLAERAARLRRRARFGLRVNPDVSVKTHPHIATGMREHKFGMEVALARTLYLRSPRHRWLEAAGISCHIGSQILSVRPFSLALARILELARDVECAGVPLRYLDAGGGLGVSYRARQRAPSLVSYAAAVHRVAGSWLAQPGHCLLLEPGRSLFAAAGTLLTRVLYVKHHGGKTFLITDAGSNDLMRPSLYGAYHEIVPLRQSTGRRQRVDVVGPICESSDYFARARLLPPLTADDTLALLDAGAYGMTLSSNYNARLRPAAVTIQRGQVKLIRRRERPADLWQTER